MDQIDDGGPAYPRQLPDVEVSPDRAAEMIDEYAGMSLRDRFAGQIIAGMAGCQDFVNEVIRGSESKDEARDRMADWAWKMADAMIRARKKPPE